MGGTACPKVKDFKMSSYFAESSQSPAEPQTIDGQCE